MLKLFVLLLLSTSVNAQTVYKTPSGAKYHTAICKMVKNVSSAITIEDALKLGLEPCKICKPVVNKGVVSAPKRTSGQAATVQCKGTTRAGYRCKHKTSIANGYCFQHQPK